MVCGQGRDGEDYPSDTEEGKWPVFPGRIEKCCERVTIPRSPDLSKPEQYEEFNKPYESGALTS
jgi:hypothetical protein